MSQTSDVPLRESWSIRPPVPKQAGGQVTVRSWCRAFDVIGALIAFDARSFDPIAYLHDIRELISEAPPTKATFSVPELTRDVGYTNVKQGNQTLHTLLRLAGMWEYCQTSRFPDTQPTVRWTNPEYVHAAAEPSITDNRERIEEIRRAASLGNLSATALADRFGVSDSSVRMFCLNNDIPWKQWRRWGLERLARSVAIVYDWTDYTHAEISEAVGYDRTTIRHHINRYADEFDVPQDPSREPWFGLCYSRGGSR